KEFEMSVKGSNESHSQETDVLRRLDRLWAAPMCAASLVALAAFSVLLHFHEREEYQAVWWASLGIALGTWPAFPLEFLFAWLGGSRRTRERLWCCLLPPLRLATRDHETGTRIWLPALGWQTASPELQQRLERLSHVPMIVVALLVLPLIAIEHYFAE